MIDQHRLVVARKDCQKFREILGDAKLFDKKRRVRASNDLVELPILREPDPDLDTVLKNLASGPYDLITSPATEKDEAEVRNLQEKLMIAVSGAVQFSLTSELKEEIPDSWEYYGDLLLLPVRSFRNPIWEDSLEEILDLICQIFRVTRVARKSSVVDDDFRSPKTDMMRGSSTQLVSRKENGITYHFDITKSMFCAGNISEKLRISRFDCRGETVVDLFAGIGYFTLPYLLHAKAAHVIACEWNPASVAALRFNLDHLGVAERCTVLEGDNREVCPHNIAHRVNLGLIPQSSSSWRTACEALRQTGGILHVHGNVECSKQDVKRRKMLSWSEDVRESILHTLQEVKQKQFEGEILHTECVKSYSPRVFHLVVDLKFSLI